MRLQWRRLWPKLELRTGQALPKPWVCWVPTSTVAQGSLLGFAISGDDLATLWKTTWNGCLNYATSQVGDGAFNLCSRPSSVFAEPIFDEEKSAAAERSAPDPAPLRARRKCESATAARCVMLLGDVAKRR